MPIPLNLFRKTYREFFLLKSGPSCRFIILIDYSILGDLGFLDSIFSIKILLGLFCPTLLFNILEISSQGSNPLFNTFIRYSLVVILNYLIIIVKVSFL